jgi:magnesium-dependent phosphatase 1
MIIILFFCLMSSSLAIRTLQPRPSGVRSLPSSSVIDRLSGGNDISAYLPKLVVFDLDHTLWTPELYQLRHIPTYTSVNLPGPVADDDIWLVDGAFEALHEITSHPLWKDTQLGIASRTGQGQWAHDLLTQFKLLNGQSIMSQIPNGAVQIFRGDKTKHFENLRQNTGISFDDMLFFDDARDGKYGNCEPVAKLGCLSAYCPRGLTTEVFQHAVQHFIECKKANVDVGKILDPPTGSSAPPTSIKANTLPTKKMKAFSMNQPFAGLLAHGIKTIETRNGTMFKQIKEDEEMILHVGRRTYPDNGMHLDILRERGLSNEEIQRVTNLPMGYERGECVAILTIGQTRLEEEEFRSQTHIEQNVVARGDIMGKHLTTVKSVKWLKRPYKIKGAPGIFDVEIPLDCL